MNQSSVSGGLGVKGRRAIAYIVLASVSFLKFKPKTIILAFYIK